jgi:hypothetical protein
MANFEGVSCEACLQADDPESVHVVAIPHALHNPARVMVLCNTCAWLIARACRGTGELPPLSEVDNAL